MILPVSRRRFRWYLFFLDANILQDLSVAGILGPKDLDLQEQSTTVPNCMKAKDGAMVDTTANSRDFSQSLHCFFVARVGNRSFQ
jgi:hypothetical protein